MHTNRKTRPNAAPQASPMVLPYLGTPLKCIVHLPLMDFEFLERTVTAKDTYSQFVCFFISESKLQSAPKVIIITLILIIKVIKITPCNSSPCPGNTVHLMTFQ